MKGLLSEWKLFEKSILQEISEEDVYGTIDPSKKKFRKMVFQQISRLYAEPEVRWWLQQDKIFEKTANLLIQSIESTLPSDMPDKYRGVAANWLKKIYFTTKTGDRLMGTRVYKDQIANSYALGSVIETFYQVNDFIDTDEFSKDLNAYQSDLDVQMAIEDAKPRYDKHLEKKMYLDAEAGSKVIYDGPEWTIYVPTNKGAACELGKGTQWCTAAPGLDYYESYHSEKDPLFIFISKKNPKEKYQFHYGSSQFMDSRDEPVKPRTLKKLHTLLASVDFPKPESFKNIEFSPGGSMSIRQENFSEWDRNRDGIVPKDVLYLDGEDRWGHDLHRVGGPAYVKHGWSFVSNVQWVFKGRKVGSIEVDSYMWGGDDHYYADYTILSKGLTVGHFSVKVPDKKTPGLGYQAFWEHPKFIEWNEKFNDMTRKLDDPDSLNENKILVRIGSARKKS